MISRKIRQLVTTSVARKPIIFHQAVSCMLPLATATFAFVRFNHSQSKCELRSIDDPNDREVDYEVV